MKKFLVCLVFFALALLAAAQAPQAINYQAIARNPQGQPIPNKAISIQISILNGSISGPAVYVETHQQTTNQFGLFTLGIGLGSAQSGTFETIDWAGAPKFLKVNIDNTLQGVTQLLSVPYALYAASAKEGQTLTLNGNQLSISSGNSVTLPGSGGAGTLNDLTDVNTAGAANGQILQWNGSQWVPVTLPPGATYTAGNGISINGNTISNTGDFDAADDITIATPAGGDLSGLYPNPTVVKIQGKDVAGTVPAEGDLLRFNSTNDQWELASENKIGWKLTGNTGTVAGVNFIGTMDDQPVSFGVFGSERMKLWKDGRLELLGADSTNTFIGRGSGYSNAVEGHFNTAVGAQSLYSNTYGILNTAVGTNTLRSNTEGKLNTAIGGWALYSNKTGDFNTAIGSGALNRNETGVANTAIGLETLSYNKTGAENTAVGSNALSFNETGNFNTGIGSAALGANKTGEENTAIGHFALFNNDSGGGNISIGSAALQFNKNGNKNTALGNRALLFNESGNNNIAIGPGAINSNVEKSNLLAIGDSALYHNTSGESNIAIGSKSLYSNTSGDVNTAIGFKALYSNTFGAINTAVGYFALENNISGVSNTALGAHALRSNRTGYGNTAIGYTCLTANFNGSENTAIGQGALGSNYNGNSNTAIGFNSGPGFTNLNATIALGSYSTPTASGSAIIGNSFITSIGGQVKGWTTFSDGRFKTNIENDIQGLAFIRHLRPVSYQYDIAKIDDFLGIPERRNALGREITPEEMDAQRKAAGIRYTGFIAQEVEQVARELGFAFSGVDAPDNEKDPYGLRYAEFTVPLVKAVQEQQALIEAQQIQLQSLQDQLLGLATELNTLKALLTKTAENK